jgi:glycosyltransferase involved in cell wall biosynthesis
VTINTCYHIVTQFLPPTPGGLELWTKRFIEFLTSSKSRVRVHLWGGQDACDLFDHSNGRVELSSISTALKTWGSPFTSYANTQRAHSELFRASNILVRGDIQNSLYKEPTSHHVLISNYALGSGVIASNIAVEFGLKHIACVVGTDYSRGIYVPAERSAFDIVAQHSSQLITFNGTQENMIRKLWHQARVRTIHPSVDERVMSYIWRRRAPTAQPLKLFSDAGYSSKKGTHILLNAVQALRIAGYNLELHICGPTPNQERDYWELQRREYFSAGISHFGQMPLAFVWDQIQNCDIYCSATLSEGCSHARCAALCIGAPIVTTHTGEMPDVAIDHPTVHLARPASQESYTEHLRRMCDRCLSGQISDIAPHRERLRSHFSEKREKADWSTLLASI